MVHSINLITCIGLTDPTVLKRPRELGMFKDGTYPEADDRNHCCHRLRLWSAKRKSETCIKQVTLIAERLRSQYRRPHGVLTKPEGDVLLPTPKIVFVPKVQCPALACRTLEDATHPLVSFAISNPVHCNFLGRHHILPVLVVPFVLVMPQIIGLLRKIVIDRALCVAETPKYQGISRLAFKIIQL